MRQLIGGARRGLLVGSLLFLPVLSPPVAAAQHSASPPTARADAALAFEGVTVVNVRDGSLSSDRTIVVAGNRIRAVGPAGRTALPPGTRVVRAHGTYVIPGLWDMHVHVLGFAEPYYPLFIAHGVTGVREMSTPFLDSVLRWRREVAAGARVGPRVLTAGLAIMPPSPEYGTTPVRLSGGRKEAWMFPVTTPEEGRRAVRALKAAGVDFIKAYDNLPRDVYFAVLAEARRVGLDVTGHLHSSVTAAEASDSGQRSIEHSLGQDGCRIVAHPTPDTAAPPPADLAACRALAARFRRNGTWFLPSELLISKCWLKSCGDLSLYLPDSTREGTIGHTHDVAQLAAAIREDRSIERWASPPTREEQAYRLMRRAGVRFLAGTDVAVLFDHVVPGLSLHDYLLGLVRGGLTPLEALQAATLNPAEYLRATDSLGTVEPGKVADLVFLDANPLADTYNTRRIRAVVANGRFFDRGDLDLLLLEAEQRARPGGQP